MCGSLKEVPRMLRLENGIGQRPSGARVQISFISSIFIAGGHGVKCCNGYVTVAVLEASCQINHCQNSWKWQTSAPSLSS